MECFKCLFYILFITVLLLHTNPFVLSVGLVNIFFTLINLVYNVVLSFFFLKGWKKSYKGLHLETKLQLSAI